MEFKSNKKEVLAALLNAEKRALTAVGEFAEGEAKVRAAVDTGNMRDSIGYIVNESEKTVSYGTNAEYAYWVEKGTSKSKAQPFITPAREENTGRITSLIAEMMRL
jgi:HK97 gp10 family phage protein